MTDSIHITLQPKAAEAKWGKKASLTPTDSGFQIHLDNAFPARSIQKAARQLDGLGVEEVTLSGDGWDLERQWAFYLGFTSAKKMAGVQWQGEAATQLSQLAHCFSWARQITNQTPEQLSPEALANATVAFLTPLAPDAISHRLITGDALLAEGWVGIHGVGRGSERPPVMLVLDYNPTGKADAPVDAVLVGKGITFDSGGYSIKPSESMSYMKCDMGGAATVAAALGLAVMKGLSRRVQLVLCCAENLISGHAYKLGDILTYKNGTSVEILNTDAEGRLVLADGLLYASETGAPLIIDAATLTGAAMVALGNDYNALFALDTALQQRALGYATEVQEPTWPLPLAPWHQGQCPSPYADTANSRPVKGGGTGGASNAAGFLSRFVPEGGKGWLHFDLAAAFNSSNGPLWAAGATGMGIRAIAETLRQEAGKG
ncbi:aminopeptidase PepB [Alkalimonas delamerensis]|uniref:Aminopeptidase PepB n=1 Tax=Alkalimonas delamerensis TaxID=265981 RepID=A0ABT9GLG2_9GAMM|nr:aminopeptidase PepB [Alkalimonas delamerensis]MDP4527806.1 aminopeptidase PepB [Alkalimonas delamerensis]